MISERDYGYRMIGTTAAASRAAYVRRRYMGASAAPSFGPLTYTAPVQVTGEGQVTRTPAAPAPVVKHIALKITPPPVAPPLAPPPLPAAVPSTTAVPLHLAPVVAAGPVQTADTYVPPLVTVSATPDDCPDCPACKSCAVPAIATGLGAALLMLGVGLATNMVKFKTGRRKNGRRRARR